MVERDNVMYDAVKNHTAGQETVECETIERDTN